MTIHGFPSAPPPLPPDHPVYGNAPGQPRTVKGEVSSLIEKHAEDAKKELSALIDNYDVGGIKEFFSRSTTSLVRSHLTEGYAPLHQAASLSVRSDVPVTAGGEVKQKGRGFEVLAVLIECMPEQVNARNEDRLTPLMVAAQAGQDYNIRALLTAGAYQEETDDRGWTALFFAALSGAVVAVQSLFDHRPVELGSSPIDARDSNGNTAFMIAMENGNLEVAKLLLEKGADINAQNWTGKTAYMLSALSDEAQGKVEWLINAGAKQDLTDYEGNTLEELLQAKVNEPALNQRAETGSTIQSAEGLQPQNFV